MDNRVDDLLSKLKSDINKLEKKELQTRKIVKDLKKLIKYSDILSLHAWMRMNEHILSSSHPELCYYSDIIAKLKDEKMLEFEQDLKDSVLAAGWAFDGQWPTFFINRFIILVINEKNYSCQIGDKQLKILSVNEIIAHSRDVISRLKLDREKLAHFLKELLESFKELQVGDAQSVSIWEIYKKLVIRRQPIKLWRNAVSANFKQFGEMEFRAYLTELLQINMTSLLGYQLKLLPPISRDDSVFVFQPAENRFCHVGRVSFLQSTEIEK